MNKTKLEFIARDTRGILKNGRKFYHLKRQILKFQLWYFKGKNVKNNSFILN